LVIYPESHQDARSAKHKKIQQVEAKINSPITLHQNSNFRGSVQSLVTDFSLVRRGTADKKVENGKFHTREPNNNNVNKKNPTDATVCRYLFNANVV